MAIKNCIECPYKYKCPGAHAKKRIRLMTCCFLPAFMNRDNLGKDFDLPSDDEITSHLGEGEIKRTCNICPNAGECSRIKLSVDGIQPPILCPMQHLPLHPVKLPGKKKKLIIPEASKYWYPRLRTFMEESKQ